MNWSVLNLLYIHEMRMLLRSRRTVVTSIVLPAVMMPLMIVGARWSEQRRQTQVDETVFQYAVTGPWSEHAQKLIENTRYADEFKSLQLREIQSRDPDAGLENGSLHFYLKTLTAGEADKAAGPAQQGQPAAGNSASPAPVTGVPAIQVVYRGNQDIPGRGANRMVDLLRSARRNESYSTLLDSGFPSHPEGILAMTAQNVATESQVSGSNVGRFFTVILVMWMVAAGSIAAMDIIAGEKERGTLETLITTAAGRAEIVTAKQLAICSVALAITLIQVLNALLYIKLRLIELPAGFIVQLSLASVLQLLALFVPMAAAIAAALLIISAYSKTYKEAQLHFFPLYLGSLVPALASVLPGLRLRSIVAFVPIANVSVAAREVLMGRPDPLMILVTVAVMTFTAAALIRFSARLLVREDIVVSAQHEQAALIGGEELFRKRVFQWFAVMWAVMFAGAANVPILQGFRGQVLFSQLVLFLGCSILMIRRYRLDIRQILGLHRLRWPVWIAVLMAVPAAQVVAMLFFSLVSTVIPAPAELLREFAKQMSVDSIPMWQMYVFVALLPGICEELAFRGILLHGLRARFHPAVVCLLVGLTFGIFHYTLFRIAPTAFLGVILTAIAFMTGSVLPGMLFHAANNAFAIWMETSHIDLSNADWSTQVAALTVFILALQTIYRVGKERTAAHRHLR